MAVAPDVHLFGKLDTIISPTAGVSVPELGSIEIALCGYGSQVPRIPSEAAFARLTQPLDVTTGTTGQGTFAAYLYNNLLIVPEGTFYTITVKNANGDIAQVNAYRFTAAGDYDLDTIIPYDPNQPPPPLPPLITNMLLILGAADNMVFDGSIYTAFKTTLPGSVTQPKFQNMVPGNLYTFIIVQDGVGNHDFDWAANVKNPVYVDHAPNSTTVQTFVADDLGELLAIGPGTYYP